MQIKMTHILRNRAAWYLLKRKMSRYNCSSCIDVSSDVSIALRNHRPVVALESTIITHGMPYPQNLEVAQQVEETVRKEVNSILVDIWIVNKDYAYDVGMNFAILKEKIGKAFKGAVPATIAIIGGRIKVGLDPEILADFASLNVPAIKTSRRDFPYVLSKGLNGGTTVAGTIMVANTVGIKVFATGGLGGVHRGGETTMDISTDLMELGRNSIAVVSSGIKSILDIEKTLEYLETQGVCVVTYGKNKNFPSFYTSNSGLESPYNVETPTEAAILINKLFEFRMNSGVLLAVPIPEEDAMEGSEIEEAINEALKEAKNRGIKGKEVTPFILNKVMNLTDGKSLTSSILNNNVKYGFCSLKSRKNVFHVELLVLSFTQTIYTRIQLGLYVL
ncbi:hypothetical protein ANN_17497 [Periplaneta americana]|uniref:Pseudouridine-5'-phosphate glycosidase n=1 Tax=Periplaneta americana TaxID=6978 RepID=A0ABQ8SUE4_PERAM|nr:hypothetical protein ANN_17497 [Periplaneta americana]